MICKKKKKEKEKKKDTLLDPGLEHATIELTLFKMATSYIFLKKDDFIILETCYQRMKI